MENSGVQSSPQAAQTANARPLTWQGLGLAIPFFLAAATTALMLLGYGSALAIEELFAVPARQTFDSSLDLFQLSHHPVIGLLDIVVTVPSWKSFALLT